MKAIKNLTESQNNLVSNLVLEFQQMNSTKQKKESQNNVIDSLFNKANDYNNKKNDFYSNIETENNIFDNLCNDTFLQFIDSLKEIFKNYNFHFESDSKKHCRIKLGESYGHIGYFSMNTYYFYEQFDSKSKEIKRNFSFDISFNSKKINYSNVLKCPIFLDEIQKMFLENPKIQKIN
jgi:hypothetical protein